MSGHEASDELAMVQAGCRHLGITLDPAWHDAILLNVRLIARQSSVLLDPALADAVEPAPIFRA